MAGGRDNKSVTTQMQALAQSRAYRTAMAEVCVGEDAEDDVDSSEFSAESAEAMTSSREVGRVVVLEGEGEADGGRAEGERAGVSPWSLDGGIAKGDMLGVEDST